MIKWSQFAVNVFNQLIVDVSYNILVVVNSERMIHLFDKRFESLSQLNFYRLF